MLERIISLWVREIYGEDVSYRWIEVEQLAIEYVYEKFISRGQEVLCLIDNRSII